VADGFLGKKEVVGSIPTKGTTSKQFQSDTEFAQNLVKVAVSDPSPEVKDIGYLVSSLQGKPRKARGLLRCGVGLLGAGEGCEPFADEFDSRTSPQVKNRFKILILTLRLNIAII
jgi:hypothetical protein